MADAQAIQRRRPRVPIEHTCDGSDKQHCRCVQLRSNERRRDARRARTLQKVPLVHTCGSSNTWSCACARARRREKYVPDSMRRYDLQKNYGLTVEQWQELFDAQEGRCGICGRHEDEVLWAEGRRGLVVDHCHETGRVRGLLCNGCNRGLGYLGDDLDRVRAAEAWLQVGGQAGGRLKVDELVAPLVVEPVPGQAVDRLEPDGV